MAASRSLNDPVVIMTLVNGCAADNGATLQSSSYLELEAKLLGTGIQGIVFDAYKTNDFKFVALDVPGSRVIVGHVDAKRGLVVDASFARTLPVSF